MRHEELTGLVEVGSYADVLLRCCAPDHPHPEVSTKASPAFALSPNKETSNDACGDSSCLTLISDPALRVQYSTISIWPLSNRNLCRCGGTTLADNVAIDK